MVGVEEQREEQKPGNPLNFTFPGSFRDILTSFSGVVWGTRRRLTARAFSSRKTRNINFESTRPLVAVRSVKLVYFYGCH